MTGDPKPPKKRDRVRLPGQARASSKARKDASGDVGVSDPPPGERGWRIAIEPPAGTGAASRYVVLKNYAITTSGDQRLQRRQSHRPDGTGAIQ